MNWRALLVNRFTITFGTLAAIVAVWNVYVSFNDDGHVAGTVLDAQGNAVAGAEVTLSRKTVASVEPVAETRTAEDGRFVFRDHGEYSLILTVSRDDGETTRVEVPLWFRNQNVELAEPIRVGG